MAKGKQAAALFEVIHSNKRFERVVGDHGHSILRTPKWWFKRRNGAPAPNPVVVPSMNEPASPEAGSTPFGAGGIRVSIDPDGQHVTLRLSYTATAVTAFTIGVIIVLAFLAGRQARPSRTLVSPVTTEELQAQPPRPEALNIQRPSTSGATPAVEPDPEPAGDAASVASPLVPPPAPNWNDTRAPATLVVDDARRTIGLNYVIVQSYAERKLAENAVNVLKQNGIDCTIEQGIKGWPASLHIVVGTRGFDKIKSQAYEDYVKKIQTVSKIFAPKGGWKAFTPIGKKWDR